jgi:hypothetical protein
MKLLIKILLVLLALSAVVILVGGYFGLVPGVSAVFGADKPRDLGVKTSEALYKSVNDKISMTRTGDAASSDKLVYSGSKKIDASFSSEEVSSLFAEGKWKNDPISQGFQMKIAPGGAVEVSGILDRAKLNGYLKFTGFTSALPYLEKFNFLPEKVPFYLNGSASVKNNQLELNLSSAQLGRVPLPTDAGTIKAVEGFADARLSAIPGMDIQSLDFNNGKLNLKGTLPSKMSF